MNRNPNRTIKLISDHAAADSSDLDTSWVALVIDDEQGVLDVTKTVLKRFRFMGRGLTLKCANSYAEAKILYQQYPQAAVALIDCTMEQNTSGLEFVEYIRNEKKNTTIQLVLRTGQPGFAPEHQVLVDYDINDYLTKTELTSSKLNHRMISYLRAYENLKTIAYQNDKLKKLDRIKDNFLSTVSHELTSPLRASKGLLSILMLEKEKIDPELVKYIQLIEGCNQRMDLLVKDLIDSSMIRRNEFRMLFSDANIYPVIEEVMPNVHMLSRYLYRQDKVTIENNVDSKLPQIRLDKTRIQQVVINLVNNALKFTKSGSIKIQSHLDKNRLTISVVDTGVGIEEKNINKIFDSFTQVESTVASPSGGVGLGLSISKKIIESHKGELTVSSEPGKGSTFTFSLPTSM